MLARYPQDANFLGLAARAQIRLKLYDEARTTLDLALSLFPSFERGHDLRGDLLLAEGDMEGAAKAFQQALALNNTLQQTRMKLGQVLVALGRIDETDAIKKDFLAFNQDNEHIARAVQLANDNKPEEAEKVYREILNRDPDNVTVMRLWAKLGMDRKFYPEAEAMLRRAVEKAPEFSRAWNDLWTVQNKQDKYSDAIESANRLIKLDPRSVNARLLLAAAHASDGQHLHAVAYFDDALEIAPDHVGALCGKGNSYRTLGQQSDAIAMFRRCITANPLAGEPYWSLANLKTFRFEQAEVDTMLALVDGGEVEGEDLVQLNNALGLEFDGRKDYDRAFGFIDNGNRLRRREEYYDPVENEETVNQLIEVFSEQFFADNKDLGDSDAAPIFIVGMPRSGSTLIEQILSSHSQVEGTFELRDLTLTTHSIPNINNELYPKTLTLINEAKFQALGAEYIRRTQQYRKDLPYFTDKNPNNFVHVGLLQLILPNATIIDARRHPLDSCFGSYKQLFASGQSFSYDIVELGEYFLQYRRIMDHWHEVLPGKVLDVHYEQVVGDLEGQVRRILDHCGLPFEESCLRFHETERLVKTASSEQVRSPLYASSVHTWRGYEPHLGELIEVLEPVLEGMGEGDRPLSMGGVVG